MRLEPDTPSKSPPAARKGRKKAAPRSSKPRTQPCNTSRTGQPGVGKAQARKQPQHRSRPPAAPAPVVERRPPPRKPLPLHRTALLHYHRRFLDRRGAGFERLSTAPEFEPEIADLVGSNGSQAHGYRPTPRALISWLLDALPVAFEDTTLVDIGAGRGRVLLEAARYPFARIVGFEASHWLHEDAMANLRHWPRGIMRCRDVDPILADALEAPLPAGALLVWAFDPFSERLLTRLAARLAEHARSACPSSKVTVVLIDPASRMPFRESAAFTAVPLPDPVRRRIGLFSPYPVRIYRAGEAETTG